MEVTRYLCLMFTAGLFGPARSVLDCFSESAVLAAQKNCLVRYGLNFTLAASGASDTGLGPVDYLDAILKQIPESVCMKQENYSQALLCLEDVLKECGFSAVIPTSKLNQVVDKLCIHDKNVRLACAAAKFNDAMKCEKKQFDQIGSSKKSSGSEFFCKLYKAQNDCQRSLYHSCGCATVRAYETIYLDIFYQAVCPQNLSSISRVECNGKDSSTFLNNPSTSLNKGVGASAGMSVLTLSLLLVATLFCYSIMF